ncbi:hypothetical protein KSZ_08130 [Dictyobacter formicarum]|uniref:Uncharacterized protein n=1 Tax=Dictyobacter formicarum TaxID=2778368 RepID=A0ABQ3VAA0_9CHLR|nr:hypothetical protein KSZ_08130 [Dictyobacter formicarum]
MRSTGLCEGRQSPFFFTSGLSTALAAISFILSLGRSKQHRNALQRLENAEIIAATTELGLISALAPTLGSLGKPLFSQRNGMLLLGGTVGSGLITHRCCCGWDGK